MDSVYMKEGVAKILKVGSANVMWLIVGKLVSLATKP